MGSPLGKWIDSLIKRGFLEHNPLLDGEPNRTYTIQTPVTVIVKPKIVERLKKRYRKDEEIGGILAAVPFVRGNRRFLVVDRVKFLKNCSNTPDQNYMVEEPWIYYSDRCLKGVWYKRRRIPIHFHSHPIKSNSYSEYVMSYFEMATSQADQKFDPQGIAYSRMKKTLYFPLALLIVTDEDQVFLGIFGGLIAPKEFDTYMTEILAEDTKKIVENTIEWGFEEGASNWRKAGSILFMGLEATQLLLKPLSVMAGNPATIALINKRIVQTQKSRKVKRYFSIQKDGYIEIEIPRMKNDSMQQMGCEGS
ncbi:MAG TPA: hypothetical protein VF172_11085 [Nitrososphaera sp.]|jgi:hypothetical protein